MNRPYSYSSTTSRRAGAYDDHAEPENVADAEAYDDYDDYDAADDDDYDGGYREYTEPIDRRWIWVAGVAGAILLVAVICTVVILGGGDSGSVTATYAPPLTTTAPVTASAAPRTPSMTAPVPAPTAPLSPETVTTVAPTPTAEAQPTAAIPAPAPSPRTITYQVTGSRQLIDLVTVIYTDGQGALQTDVNVALPWAKQVVLNPGVDLTSVTATSMLGQLNCSITDAAGATVVAQNNNTMITTCTR
jgi:hypothetical protein